jgi:hypothetical protein
MMQRDPESPTSPLPMPPEPSPIPPEPEWPEGEDRKEIIKRIELPDILV